MPKNWLIFFQKVQKKLKKLRFLKSLNFRKNSYFAPMCYTIQFYSLGQQRLPKNKRSRLDVQINQMRGTEMTIQDQNDQNSSAEEERSMPYYEVPNQKSIPVVARPFASTSFVVAPNSPLGPNSPLPPIPSEQRSYSTINQTLSSRLV